MAISLELASKADDPGIRRLLAANSVPGRIRVAFTREPNYFLGCGTMGRFCQVVVARHEPTGEVVGVGCRASRPVFVNGQVEEVGYLGQLRVDPSYRGRSLVSRGFRLVRDLHADGRVRGYITTITEENTEARGILVERARRHFPIYRELDRFSVVSLIVGRAKSSGQARFAITPGAELDLGRIVAFLQRYGAAKQFYPFYTEEDFSPQSATTRGFCLEDLAVAHNNGDILGTMGLWDQSEYKQIVVTAYTGTMRWIRTWYNLVARVKGTPPLAAAGEPMRVAYGCFVCMKANDPGVFESLLHHLCNDAARRGYTCLIVGLSARDPLLSVARRCRHVAYQGRLYSVCWEEERSFHERLDSRIPYLEAATL
jgi:hypothetical protein